MRKTALLSLLLLLTAPLCLRAQEDAARRRGSLGKALVTAPRLRVRNAPAVTADPLGAVLQGVPLVLIDKSSFSVTIDDLHAPWYRVRTLGGKFLQGWAFGGYLAVAPEPVDGLDPWLSAFCYADLKAFGDTLETAAAKLGPPLSVQVKEQANRHAQDQTDKVKTAHFTGVTLRLTETPYKTFLEQTVLSSDVAGLNDPLKMGTSPRHAREILGDPERDDMKVMTYACNLEQNDSLILTFTLDKLASIEWSHFAD